MSRPVRDWSAVELGPQERLDDLLCSGRHIIQNKEQFCFSIDAVLLARYPRYRKSWRVFDLGTGTGVMPLLIADEVKEIHALEINPVMAELAQRNVQLNGLEDKIHVQQGDYRRIRELYPAESFDCVIANPPYRPLQQGTVSALEGVASARHEVTATLEDVVKAARYLLKFHGKFAMVHLPERLGEREAGRNYCGHGQEPDSGKTLAAGTAQAGQDLKSHAYRRCGGSCTGRHEGGAATDSPQG